MSGRNILIAVAVVIAFLILVWGIRTWGVIGFTIVLLIIGVVGGVGLQLLGEYFRER
jgi:hypothetical protein